MYKLAGLLIKFETKIDSSRIKPRPKSLKPIKNVSTNDVHLLNKRKDKELFEKRRNNSSVAGARTRYWKNDLNNIKNLFVYRIFWHFLIFFRYGFTFIFINYGFSLHKLSRYANLQNYIHMPASRKSSNM